MSTPIAEPKTDTTPPRPAERFLLLDGLRGVAAFAVILDHVPSGMLGDLVPGRALSVDFFFVLSGFVLAHAYGRKLEAGWSPWAFIQARIIRLYPMYLAGTLIGIALAALLLLKGWGNAPSMSELLTYGALALFFLPQPPTSAYGGTALYPFNGPAWSLFFELIANVFYAFVTRFLSLRVLLVILPVGAVLLALSVLNHPAVRGPGWLWPHLDAGLARVMFDFFAGIAIYKLRETTRLPSLPWWAAVVFFLAVIAAPVSAEWAPAYDAFTAIVLMPLLVMLACGANVSGGVARVCTAFGTLSYGVYVLHAPLYAALQTGLQVAHVDLPHSALAPVIVAVMAGVAAALGHVLYDKPIRGWLTRLIIGKKPSARLGKQD